MSEDAVGGGLLGDDVDLVEVAIDGYLFLLVDQKVLPQLPHHALRFNCDIWLALDRIHPSLDGKPTSEEHKELGLHLDNGSSNIIGVLLTLDLPLVKNDPLDV